MISYRIQTFGEEFLNKARTFIFVAGGLCHTLTIRCGKYELLIIRILDFWE